MVKKKVQPCSTLPVYLTYCMEVLAVFDDGVGVLCQDASFSAISCDLETGASSHNCATNQDLIG